MAEIFRAVVAGPEGFRRQVVLKRILSGHARTGTYVDLFVQEARISAMLHHPNIIQVFDFGQVGGTYYLAMELLDGWELRAVMSALRRARIRMPIEVALHIAHQVLRGLSHAHTLEVDGQPANIVHRDVSPSNIMCLKTGGVKLLDFGVASLAQGADAPMARRQFCGKVAYAAPEYVRGTGQDARIDVFAVGVVLWELLTGQRLFRARSDRDTIDALFTGPIVEPSSIRAAVSPEADRIVLKALERDPERRYQSADEMADELEQLLSDRRYKPQALPRLLNHLFAGGVPVTPEPTTTTASGARTSRPFTGAPTRPELGRPPKVRALLQRISDRRVLAMVGGLAIVTLASLVMLSTRARAPEAPVAAEPDFAPVVQAIPPPAPSRPVRTRTGGDGGGGGGFLALPPSERPSPSVRGERSGDDRRWTAVRSTRPPRAAASTARRKRDLAVSDRVVDPFAEAAARGSLP